jgi:small-conductance mechanosensitive channel
MNTKLLMNIKAPINELKSFIANVNPAEFAGKFFITLLTMIFILAVFNLVQFILSKSLKNRIGEGQRQVLKKGVRFTGFVLAMLYVFEALGIDITPILGAAGIAGIVIGFAAQTSVSSIISGFFLLSEKAFTVGDVIRIGDVIGVVLSVDFLSIKLRTFDNLFIRIPNETIIKNNLISITRFPIRRLDISFTVSFSEDMEKLRDILFKLAAANRYCLENPPPFFMIDKFSDSGIVILFWVWFEGSNFLDIKNSIYLDIIKRFDLEEIKLPYRKIDLAVTGNFQVPETAG